MGKSDFIGRCQTNIELHKSIISYENFSIYIQKFYFYHTVIVEMMH